MKRKTMIVAVCVIVGLVGIAGTAIASNSMGPAPNSGDGDPDGSGFDVRPGPNGELNGYGHLGPAPNSGDGIPDGPGWDEEE